MSYRQVVINQQLVDMREAKHLKFTSTCYPCCRDSQVQVKLGWGWKSRHRVIFYIPRTEISPVFIQRV